MGIFTSPVALMNHQKARFAGVKVTMKAATAELAKGGYEDFKSQTVGGLSTRQLRQMGHPYARSARVLNIAKLSGYRGVSQGKRHQITSKGRVEDLPINRQSGKLNRGVRLISKNGGTMFDLFSDVPHAKFVLALDGTLHMRPRGLLGPKGLLRKRHKARHAGIVQAVRLQQRKP
jgi:hypothetical protein